MLFKKGVLRIRQFTGEHPCENMTYTVFYSKYATYLQ